MSLIFEKCLNRSKNTFKKYNSYTQYNSLLVETFFKNYMKMSKESKNKQTGPKNRRMR